MDLTGPTADDIAKLISIAGSPEAVIQQLLLEKQHLASREAQLWRLLEKQKVLLSGLNKDLDRALKDKETFKGQLHEQLKKVPPLPEPTPKSEAPGLRQESESPKDTTNTRAVLRQETSARDVAPNENSVEATRTPQRKPPVHMGSSPLDPAMVPSPLHLLQQQVEPPVTIDRKQSVEPSKETLESSRMGGEITPKPRIIDRTAQAAPKLVNIEPSRTSTHATLASLPPLQSSMAPPSLALIEPSPMTEKSEKQGFPSRKAPPAPLNLNQPKRASAHLHQAGPEEHSESEYDDILEVDEIPAFERGRRKTREDDDREREAAVMKEQESRSQSKKQKPSKSKTPDKTKNPQTPTTGLPSSPRQFVPQSPPANMSNHLSAQSSIAAVLSPPSSDTSSLREQHLIASPPMSPGLPASPRPGDRPLGSPLPRMPRDGPMTMASPPLSPRNGLPLSPRAPKHPIPLPPNTPLSLASPPATKTEMPAPAELRPSDSLKPPGDHQQMRNGLAPSASGFEPPPQIYRGYMSNQYPDLLLPPNALPSIEVKTSSSRLRPSRNSYMAPKATDEEPVFTLSIFSRSDRSELWRVEKVTLSLPHLDHQIKQVSRFNAKIPDRQLFSGHSPAKIDARRAALDQYFDSLLNTQLDEGAALVLCMFLSTDVIEPRDDETSLLNGPNPVKTLVVGPDGRPRKEGYLTKRGKNFGGWKARFFVLQGPELKYYDSPGGPHLGNIKLQNAQIGKQSQNASVESPSRSDEDGENQYRHAFLVLEPKRHNANKLIRHVLCAESDAERDSWVEALLKYVDYPSSEDESSKAVKSRRDGPSHITGLNAKIRLYAADSAAFKEADSPDSDKSEALRAVPYEETVPAEAPRRGPAPERRVEETPSPPVTILSPPTQPPPLPPSQSAMSISGPTNGVRIEDAGAWGNRPVVNAKETSKEHKKRSIWGFRQRSSSDLIMQLPNDSNSSLPQGNGPERKPDRKGSVRAAFGMPLAEAVECCPPDGIDVNLPAVVYRCIEYLDAKGAASEEGIFRLSGSNVIVKALKERFNTEGDVDFLADDHYYDVHAVASLLKLYLRELPTTVLTRELHLDFLHVLELDDKKKKVPAFNSLVHRLPRANWSLLRALSQFLITVINNSDKNKMTVRNVGIVFSPTLNIPAPVFSMFLTEFDGIFGPATAPSPPVEAAPPATKVTEIHVDKSLTTDDIRSPRHQMFSDIPTPAYNQNTFPNLDRKLDIPTSQAAYDTGFIPMQPSYEQQVYGAIPYDQRNGGQSGTAPSAEPQYGSMNRMLAPANVASLKAKRRESSMLFMGMGNRKSSIPRSREDQCKRTLLLK
jgi:RalA-binding protein 1